MTKKYCIQKHDASHLHYDLRLEYEGVAKSWALPKKPVFKTDTKRLAVQTNDHDIDYMDFEGEIEEGYGAGTVELWDTGEWEIEKVTDKKITGVLKGKKFEGPFALIHMNKKNWLFFKRISQ